MKTSAKWTYSGDLNMLDYGGKNIRHIGARQFQIVELINMDEACGRDNEGQPKYVVELRLVDLEALSAKNIADAMQCCGCESELNNDGEEVLPADNILAEVCDSYGCHAPLESYSGNNARKLLRQAYTEANRLCDTSALEDRLERAVNKIGSTARKFMTGDITSALQRGCESGNADARLMAKIYQVDQQTIDDTRPIDWLPYVFGYTRALAGAPKETDPDTVPEYFRGYDRGIAVKAGTAPAPSWIKQTA